MMFRPMPILTVLSVLSLIILVKLGNWQYGRYTQKMAVSETVRTEAPAEIVSAIVETDNAGMAQQVYGAIDGEPVWRRYVPARLDGDGERVLLLWDATGGPGSVPLLVADAGEPFSRVANVLTRTPIRGRFAAQDNPEGNEWYTLDPSAMARQLGYADAAPRIVETLAVTIRNSADMSRARRAANPYAYETFRDTLPPQRHFGYALTWWGMAIGLLGVYFVFHHSQGRLRFRS